jgi:predicted lipoprotein with Yx(FWY)xxD motif
MTTTRTYATAVLALAVLALSACGGSGSTSSPAAAGGTTDTVSTADVSGTGTVLVDSKGMALYSPDQEKSGKIMCTGECVTIWVPLTVTTAPTGSSDVAAKLGTVTRPDGATQVTFDGKPLYTFAEDSGPNTVTGNGTKDTFGSKSFTWHVAAPGAVTTTSSGGGYGY